MRISSKIFAFTFFLITFSAMLAFGLKPEKDKPGQPQKFFKPELYISSANVDLQEVLNQLPNKQEWNDFFTRHGQNFHVFIDPRTAKPTNIMGAVPLIPGNGVGNRVSLTDISQKLGRNLTSVDSNAVADLVRDFIQENRKVLAIDTRQLGKIKSEKITEDLWQVSVPQEVSGIPVRHGRIIATISHGNLIVLGTANWADVSMSTLAKVPKEKAIEKGFAHAGGRKAEDRIWKNAQLEIVPYAPSEYQSGESFAGPIGKGLRHRLVWSFGFERERDGERWEALVDANDEELLAFEDTNHYIKQRIVGGVYPLTDTEVCPSAEFCGVMQQVFPMPWTNTGLAAPNNFTNSAGVFEYTSGAVTTTLNGKYIRVSDSCGAASKSANGWINMGGTNGQHDCVTPGSGGAGNTAPSRSAFYELNKIAEQGRGWLPNNAWLQQQLTANVNINNTCNGFWNGSTVNFYRSGGGCRNTGELAGVFDHEWGHGLDDFDAAGVLSNSSEGYADIAAIYRYQASCVGYGFFWTVNDGCGQTADGTGFNSNESQTGTHCDTNCSGVRDADWAKHVPATPDTPQNFVCSQCLSSSGPCGRQVHCAAAPTRQAAWDLVTRDLTAAPFNYNSNTAFAVANKIFYQGSGNVGLWHACDCTAGTSNGCAAENGYIQWLTADDDNGNLNDGTPHMSAIHAAFNRHNIACGSPTPVNSGCSGAPTAAPTVTPTATESQISLSWNAVAGASKYWVLRTEGHAGCNYGKVNLTPNGHTTTSYVDTDLLNGRTYYYSVVAVGASNSCFGPLSACVSATPTATCSLPASPVNTTPANGATNVATNATLDWSDVGGAISYDVEIATDSGFTNIVRASNVQASNWTITPDLNNTTNYFWRVRANNTCDPGPYGPPFSFTTAAPPPGTAVYDATLKAPKCSTVNPQCDSAALLNGRNTLGPEPNQPNTINNSCADGPTGTFHGDESNDKIRVSTLDGSNLDVGKTVRIDATVWAWITPSADSLDLYYAANANSPSWVFIATIVPPVAGTQTLSANYVLPSGSLQAVRARFRYQGTAAPCGAGAYDDHDDLIFAVGTGGCTLPGTPSLSSPTNGATGQSTSPVLDWSDVSGATSYDVQVATDAGFTNVIRSANVATSTWTVTPALANSTTYFWRARAVNSCGPGSFASAFSFTTAAAPVGDFLLSCSPTSHAIVAGQTGTSTCTISSINGFNAAVTLSCTGLPAKTSCTFAPNPATPPANGSTTSTLSLKVNKGAPTGTFSFQVRGVNGSNAKTQNMQVTITRK